jgi:septum formation protein
MAASVPDLVLASTSQRRVELLGGMGLAFRTVDPEVDEAAIVGATPVATAEARARVKALAAARVEPAARVLAADTVVALEGVALGKASSVGEVAAMLRRLSGRRHSVTTAVALCDPDRGATSVASDTAHVVFRELSDEEVTWYAGTGEGVGKAGGYAVQGLGGTLVALLDGDVETVIGLPTTLVRGMLEGREG